MRSALKPLGRKDSKACQDGNLLAVRALVLVVLAAAKAVFWVLEQPMTVMEWHPLFQKVIRMTGMHKLLVTMGKFGAPTPKRTLLYTSSFPASLNFLVVLTVRLFLQSGVV